MCYCVDEYLLTFYAGVSVHHTKAVGYKNTAAVCSKAFRSHPPSDFLVHDHIAVISVKKC